MNDLAITFTSLGRQVPAVDGVSFELRPHEVLALVGESGSGKSVTAMSILGLLPANAHVQGTIEFHGSNIVALGRSGLRRLRAQDISVIFQDPVAALNPVHTIGFQLVEAVRQHDSRVSTRAARTRAIELLTAVGIPAPADRMSFYPHQLSGGQCQRVMIAIALASEPELLIADEPTTALDVTVQAGVLDLLRDLRDRLGTAVLLITHDMGVVADLADRVVVMRTGKVVESEAVNDIFANPREEYTRSLLAAVPRIGQRSAEATSHRPAAKEPPALSLENVSVDFTDRRRRRSVRAVSEVSMTIEVGEVVGLVGESGSGKSTLGKCVLGIVSPTTGTVRVAGRSLTTASGSELRQIRSRIGVVFQSPSGSVDPRYTVAQSIAEPLVVHAKLSGKALSTRVDQLLELVDMPGAWGSRYPRELSGGQLQRVSIARAIATDPTLLIADEPTSALDVSVQSRLLQMLKELQSRLGFACLFISHNLAVVDQLCERVMVMSNGTIVESGHRSEVLINPREPYTRRLLAASPVPDPDQQALRREQFRRLTADRPDQQGQAGTSSATGE